jgi:hypothetical protein
MHEKKALIRYIGGLVRVARFLDVPVIMTEQAPQKIGKTVPEISGLLKGQAPIAKTSFSCCGQPKFREIINLIK